STLTRCTRPTPPTTSFLDLSPLTDSDHLALAMLSPKPAQPYTTLVVGSLLSTLSAAAPKTQCKNASRPCDDKIAGYDYIIVGGGPAGLVLANTLSAHFGTSILLLEAEMDTSGVEDVYIPGLAGNNEFSNRTWNYYVTP
ncbi:hypothetical protein LTR86_011295, partial [Recurvomyces mirabilis]